jgi:hypothetical protein
MRPDYPRRSRTRNQNDDSEGNAGVAIRRLLQTKRGREQSDENDRIRERNQIWAEKLALSAPADAPTAGATIRSSESVNVAPRVDLHYDRVAIAAQYASGICTSRAIMTDAVAATIVRMACVIEGRFFSSQAQTFMRT